MCICFKNAKYLTQRSNVLRFSRLCGWWGGSKILRQRNYSMTPSSGRFISTCALVGHLVKRRTTARKENGGKKIQHGGQASCCALNSGTSCSATLFKCQHAAARPQKKTHKSHLVLTFPSFRLCHLCTCRTRVCRIGDDKVVVFPLQGSCLYASNRKDQNGDNLVPILAYVWYVVHAAVACL